MRTLLSLLLLSLTTMVLANVGPQEAKQITQHYVAIAKQVVEGKIKPSQLPTEEPEGFDAQYLSKDGKDREIIKQAIFMALAEFIKSRQS